MLLVVPKRGDRVEWCSLQMTRPIYYPVGHRTLKLLKLVCDLSIHRLLANSSKILLFSPNYYYFHVRQKSKVFSVAILLFTASNPTRVHCFAYCQQAATNVTACEKNEPYKLQIPYQVQLFIINKQREICDLILWTNPKIDWFHNRKCQIALPRTKMNSSPLSHILHTVHILLSHILHTV